MEGKNNNTTIGGVTFGGGPLDPFAGNNNQSNQKPPLPPNAQIEANGQVVVPRDEPQLAPSALGVQVVSPTHFDIPQPAAPVQQNSRPASNIPQPQPIKKPGADASREVKKFSTMAIIFGALMVIFMVLAIVGLVFGMQTQQKLTETQASLDKSNTIIAAVEQTTGVSPIDDPTKVPVYKATTGYIYISEWNIKIKVPDDLDKVSYYIDQNYRPHICFNAVQKGIQYFPDFANISLNTGRQGCLWRVAVSEGSTDPETHLSFGTNVFTYKDYNYFYTGPAGDYSKDAANLGLEHKADQIIKTMLEDNIAAYE